MEKRRLPVGIQTLRTIRARNCYYFDKTPHVLRLVEEGSHYFLWRSRYSAAVMIFSITAAKLGMGCPATQAHHIVRETKMGTWQQFPLWDSHGYWYVIQAVGCNVPNAKTGLWVMGARRGRTGGPGVAVDVRCAGSIPWCIRLRAGTENVPETPAVVSA